MVFKCKQCSLEFQFQFEIIMHQVCHENVPPKNINKENESHSYQCHLCGLSFINQDHLKNHLAQHLEGSLLFTRKLLS